MVVALGYGRTKTGHVGTGAGFKLFCAGVGERFPDIRLTDAVPHWHDSLILRGVKALPVIPGRDAEIPCVIDVP